MGLHHELPRISLDSSDQGPDQFLLSIDVETLVDKFRQLGEKASETRKLGIAPRRASCHRFAIGPFVSLCAPSDTRSLMA